MSDWRIICQQSTSICQFSVFVSYIEGIKQFIFLSLRHILDDFKHINVNYGHDVGDIVLQRIAQTVLSCVRKTDVVIRYGGDEFVIIFFSIPQEK